MDEKKTFKQEVKEWWQENKKAVKAGVICGLAGVAYGFIKGTLTVSNMLMRGDMYVIKPEDPDWDSDRTLTEENCDDPELLELVKFENENS